MYVCVSVFLKRSGTFPNVLVGCEMTLWLTHSSLLVGNCKTLAVIATPVAVVTYNLALFS